MSDNEQTIYPGKNIDVSWDGELCIHIGECGYSKGKLFIGGRNPWCQPDLVDDGNVFDVVKRCPTGALSYNNKNGDNEQAGSDNSVQIAYNGPLFVKGDLDIDGADNKAGLRCRAALCRCGHSKNKPFCDNSHVDAGFSDFGAVGDEGETLQQSGGALHITAAPDGPLLVKGNFVIHASSGRDAWQGTQAALCRCGHSKNKPFCDGSHKAAGFKSD